MSRCCRARYVLSLRSFINALRTTLPLYCLYYCCLSACLLLSILRFSEAAINRGGRPSSTAVQGWSYYFDGSSYLEIPLNINPNTLPSLTIGAWVKPASQDDALPVARCVLCTLHCMPSFLLACVLACLLLPACLIDCLLAFACSCLLMGSVVLVVAAAADMM